MTSALRTTISRERWPIIAFLLAGIAVAAVIVAALPPVYTATARSFVAQRSASIQSLDAGSAHSQQVAASYANAATAPIVLDRVVQRLHLTSTSKQLARQISVEVPSGTVIIQVSATDGSASRAAAIANGVVRALAESASALKPKTTDVRFTVVQSASVPTGSANRFLLPALLAGLLVGLLAAAGWVLLRMRRLSA